MKTVLQLLPELAGARVVGDLSAVRATRVHTDTRSLQAGDLFVALHGERFDGAQFLPEAAAKDRWPPCATRGPRRNWPPAACPALGCRTSGRRWASWRTLGASAWPGP